MGTSLDPHLVLPSSAAEALEFYRDVFGGTVTTTRFRDVGLTDGPDADKVMRGKLAATPGFVLWCGDTPTGMAYEPGRSVALRVGSDDEQQLRRWFAALADGGRVTVPLAASAWGEECGQVIDRYGTVWVFTRHR